MFKPLLYPAALTLLLVGALGCASQPVAPEDSPQDVVERPAPDYSEAPEGYSEAEILAILASPEGPVLMLTSQERETMLPIFINMSQAMAIELRREGRDFMRPLTHDLVEDMMDQLDGDIAKVQIDALRQGTFYATIFLIGPDQVFEIDARPSDAVALAAGREIPIYVADSVLDEAGMTDEDIRHMPPADPGDPEDYDDAPTTPL